MRRLGLLVGSALLALAIVFPVAAADGDQLEVPFTEQNDSGITGTATFVEQAGKTTVTVDLIGSATDVEQPSHIHVGTCDNLDPLPTYPLNNIVDGHSETVVDVTIATLLASPFAVNVHKSAEEIDTYVACAEIVASTSGQVMPNTGGGQNSDTLPIAAIAGLVLIALGGGLFVVRQRMA
ncbi:MAG: LPXTG cell wall anchor domain-containing protein [Thermomicrobiales bacterium]|nr:LPXTG cell wall anchor domain-containing protein [Thermomicrobiales bacterium]